MWTKVIPSSDLNEQVNDRQFCNKIAC